MSTLNRVKNILGGEINLDYSSLSDEKTFENNAENVIGYVGIPLGVAGKFEIKGDFADGDYVLPLATTEACLIASVHRGAKALSLCEAVNVKTKEIGVTRSVVFEVSDNVTQAEIDAFFAENKAELKAIAQSTSSHLVLLDLKAEKIGKNLFLKGYFNPADAMGMNMVTIAMKAVADNLESTQGWHMVSISSNDCADKKPSLQVKKEGRGLSVITSVNISEEILKSVLKTDIAELKKVYEAKIVEGSKKAKLLGQNAHHGNIISAFFAATGQDLAHGAEMSIGDTKIDFHQDHIAFSVVLPDVMIGAIGGGTSLPLQKQIIDLIGLKKDLGDGQRRKEMAEVLAVGVLSGELSLLCALASHRLASSHNEFRKGIK